MKRKNKINLKVSEVEKIIKALEFVEEVFVLEANSKTNSTINDVLTRAKNINSSFENLAIVIKNLKTML